MHIFFETEKAIEGQQEIAFPPFGKMFFDGIQKDAVMQNLISQLRTILLELSSFWDMLKKKTQLYLEIFKTFSQDS